MSTKLRRSKTRTSKEFCQEKLCCRFENTEAVYQCVECDTRQCIDCEENIHSRSVKYEFHDRCRIQPPTQDSLCQSTGIPPYPECKNRNFADVRCEQCALLFCFDCNDTFHNSSRRKTHKRISYKDYKQKSLQAAFSNPIIPSSPLDEYCDASLTYLSAPQESMDDQAFISFHSDDNQGSGSIPDVCMSTDKDESLLALELAESMHEEPASQARCFLIASENEDLQIDNEVDWIEKLGCEEDTTLKVVSIFGNTGDGKSHTLNQVFFGGREIFKTSPSQDSCTIGIWGAFDRRTSTFVIDTEGLLGVTSNQNQRTRLLLKVLAISDVVIYRTKADRLHNDLFYFLSDASGAYLKHFSDELREATRRCKMNLHISNLGPAVIIFHETQHTDTLGSGKSRVFQHCSVGSVQQRTAKLYTKIGERKAEDILRKRFHELERTIDAFSDIKYVGTRTRVLPTDFKQLTETIRQQLNNNSIRAQRRPEIVYQSLKVLNEKFSGEIEKPSSNTFPDQYFTCAAKCLSCGVRCTRSMNHDRDNESHEVPKEAHCKYQHQFKNKVYLCKHCFLNGNKENIVIPKTSSSEDNAWLGFAKYVWSGYILECPSCGIIFSSRQYWYGNKEVESIVRVEIRHIWPGGDIGLEGAHNAGRKIIDGFNFVADTISSVGAKPSKAISDWMTDQIAPAYWEPNSAITCCRKCERVFSDNEQKHHCRSCGKGFCDNCSTNKRPVPERGWGDVLVRVCDKCYKRASISDSDSSTASDVPVTARKVGEVVGSTIGVLASAMDYPLDMIKATMKPDYWEADDESTKCPLCELPFSAKLHKHHCRSCGRCVCSPCSPQKAPVPLRAWDYPVRVCITCHKKLIRK